MRFEKKRNSAGEEIAACFVLLFVVLSFVVSIGIPIALIYAAFHFICRFW